MRFKGKTVIVTGGSSGIGKAISKSFAREGAKVVVASTNPNKYQKVVDEIVAENGEAIGVQTDVTDLSSVTRMVEQVINQYGQIHILVNNAGWDKFEPFIQSKVETWEKIINLNFRGPINCCRVVLPHMVEKGYGKVVTVVSEAGRVGSTGQAVYSASKGGMIAFTKSIAREMARYKINVNCVASGLVETPLLEGFIADNPKLIDAMIRTIPWRRIGKPEEIAPAVLFLASDETEYITGQTLSVSGGLTMV